VNSNLKKLHTVGYMRCAETARVQEDAAGTDLPDLVYDSPQLRRPIGHVSDVLYRVQRPVVGSRTAGTAMHRVWSHGAREMQRSTQRRLHPTSVLFMLVVSVLIV